MQLLPKPHPHIRPIILHHHLNQALHIGLYEVLPLRDHHPIIHIQRPIEIIHILFEDCACGPAVIRFLHGAGAGLDFGEVATVDLGDGAEVEGEVELLVDTGVLDYAALAEGLDAAEGHADAAEGVVGVGGA